VSIPSSAARPRRTDGGFTLLEVLAAFAVLSLAVAGLVYMGTMSIRGNARSEDQAAAVALATDKVEWLKGLDFHSPALTDGSAASGIYALHWTVGAEYSLNGVPAKDLAVRVSWTGGGEATLSTTIIDPPALSAGAYGAFPTAMIASWTSR
jgi:prepilin-type N-terminal cleavage/methylation domain-containing protein